jgi:UDP-N-acetylmuramyl tripeptide synthase
VETIEVEGKPVSILLIKNPAGANEVLRTLRLESDGGGLDLWIALNDKIADGRDVSWVWDADFELLSDHVRHVVCAGTRAPEMALRLKYAGWPQDRIEVSDGVEASLDQAVAGAPERLFALPTYTALLELRTKLADRGLAGEYWE